MTKKKTTGDEEPRVKGRGKLPEDVVPRYDTDEDKPLSPEQQLAALRFTRRQAQMLNRLAAGGVINGRAPGTREILGALSLKASLTQARPKASDGGPAAPTIVQIVNPYADNGEPIELGKPSPEPLAAPEPPAEPEDVTPEQLDALRLADAGHTLTPAEKEEVRTAREAAALSPEEREVRRRVKEEDEELKRFYRNRDLRDGPADYDPWKN